MQPQYVYFPVQNRNAWCIPPLRSQHLAPQIIIRVRWKDTWSSMIPKRQKLEKKNNQWCIFKNICMCYYPVACVKAAPVFSFTSTHKKVPSYWNLLFPWIISIFSPNPSTSALSTRAAACAQDITYRSGSHKYPGNVGVKEILSCCLCQFSCIPISLTYVMRKGKLYFQICFNPLCR